MAIQKKNDGPETPVTASAAYAAKMKEAKDAEAHAEGIKSAAVAEHKEGIAKHVEALLGFGIAVKVVDAVEKKARKPRGPNKPKTTPTETAVAAPAVAPVSEHASEEMPAA